MGTRRSKHDRGRKPRRKDKAAGVSKAIWDQPDFEVMPTAQEILARPAYQGGLLLNKRLDWNQADTEKLQILCKAAAAPDKSSIALGRDAKTLARKARDLGIVLPPAWQAILPKAKYTAHPRERRVLLNYPFFIHVDKDKDAELIAVNKLVPKGLPDHMRGDICQDILLAVYEGKVNLTTLQSRPDLVKQFVSRWRKENLERGGYGMMSIDPYGDDKRSWEEQAAARADWDWNQTNDARAGMEAMSMTFTPATQEDDYLKYQIECEQRHLHSKGQFLSHVEVSYRMSQGIREHRPVNLIADRIKIAKFIEECGFTCSPMDSNPLYLGENTRFSTVTNSMETKSKLSQYIAFTIPGSNIGTIRVRVSDHQNPTRDPERDAYMIDSYELGVDGVLKVLTELAENVNKYETIKDKHSAFEDSMAGAA